MNIHDFFPLSLALNLRPKERIGRGVMQRHCVIQRWVQRKTDQKLHINCVFCFQDRRSLCFILFVWFICSKNMFKHTLTHTIAKKKSTFALKN